MLVKRTSQARSERAPERVVSARAGVIERVRDIWRYRELLEGLVRKELKVKYKNSILGFLWSMLNPLLYLVIFTVVFQVFLKNGIPEFPIFLLSGLLAWNLFATALASATTSIIANGSIVKKIYFPREILPLASVGAGLVHFFLQVVVLLGALVVFRHGVSPTYLLMTIPALLVLLVLLSAFAIALAAINVYLRDTQHLLELVLLAWFWMTPIVYPYRLVADRLADRGQEWAAFLNPITSIVLVFQRAIYNDIETGSGPTAVAILPDGVSPWWYLQHLAVVGGIALVLLVGALSLFGRLEGNFAEEL